MKTFIFMFDYKWNRVGDAIPLKEIQHQCVVVVAESVEIAMAIAKTEYNINLSQHDLVATLGNNECWVKDK